VRDVSEELLLLTDMRNNYCMQLCVSSVHQHVFLNVRAVVELPDGRRKQSCVCRRVHEFRCSVTWNPEQRALVERSKQRASLVSAPRLDEVWRSGCHHCPCTRFSSSLNLACTRGRSFSNSHRSVCNNVECRSPTRERTNTSLAY
jgi:hypothetical protein